ncbi:hypothetical protein [Paraglaciecola sp.]|uniref:hypothetical protein n=1 Tax=Paraglaciecola sp. TaxID=1920173 RepID=UPI0032631FAC
MKQYDSPYIKVIDNKSSNSIVYFSSVDVPEGKFNGTSAVEGIDSNIIFVNCKGNTWYLSGIPHLAETVKELANFLRNLTDELSIGKDNPFTLYFGGSMGGYGALLYGCLNNASKVIATGVETNLTKAGGYAANLSSFDFSKIVLPNIVEIAKNSSTHIVLVFGEDSPKDYQDLFPFEKLVNVSIISLPNCGHKVPIQLEKSLGIKKLLSSTLKGEALLKTINGKLIRYPHILKMLSGLINFNAKLVINILEQREDIDSTVKAILYENLGRNIHSKNPDKAIDYYKLATLFNPARHATYLSLANAYLQAGNAYQFKINIEAAITLTKINRTESVEYQYYLLADGLNQLKKTEESLATVTSKLNDVNVNTPLGKLIVTLKEKINNEKRL